ncbi:hypothetical protein BOTBODRAFT_468928 [Botryobasidium botryosum FD-172 SS1]|uniref:Transmembrane protein n=1 Tax=Botryobasidium botryosum (strain FD-172 SS1) TaxID=930990 RepID=A0A067MGF1_BOTB1|nr:hypothetical protein BOTBODRAFT_468928 [Botryobasidium botryosum FD-172 SS1]
MKPFSRLEAQRQRTPPHALFLPSSHHSHAHRFRRRFLFVSVHFCSRAPAAALPFITPSTFPCSVCTIFLALLLLV